MTETAITVCYGGEWKKEKGSYQWFNEDDDKATVIVIDTKIKIAELVDKLYIKLGVNRSKTEMKLSFKSTAWDASIPIYIRDDDDVIGFLMVRDEKNLRGSLCVELIERHDNSLVLNDLEEGLDVEDKNQDCDPVIHKEHFRDTYFDRTFTEANTCDVPSTPRIEGTNLIAVDGSTMASNEVGTLESTSILEELYVVKDCESSHGEASVSHSFIDGTEFQIGQNFGSKDEVKNKLTEVAIKNCFEMKIVKSCKQLYVVKCVDENCKWQLRAAKLPNSNFFSIRTYHNTHTCSLEKRKKKHRQASAALVADMVVKNFKDIKETPSPKALMGMMAQTCTEITYWKAWMGKQIANSLRRGSAEESFQLLPRYLYMVGGKNHGTITHLEVDESNHFKYLFLALGPAIRGFSCMRKVIAIDGTFLKTKYKGCLLVATAQDGNRHCYPIAWGVVDSENDKSWTWFLTKLQEIIPDNGELVFISDRNQSIKNAVGNVFKNSHHGYCMWHIEQNLKHRFTCKDAMDLFKSAAQSYQVSLFNQSWNEIRNRYPAVESYLTKTMDFSHWSRAYFRGDRYNIMTTGGAESINKVLKEARSYPLISMLDKIVEVSSCWFYKHREEAASCSTAFTPKIEGTLRKRFMEAQQLKATPLNMFEYNVTGGKLDAIVDLCQKSCSCRVFDIDRLPCAHALAAVEDLEIVCKLSSKFYTVETWALAYAETIYPVPPISEWDIPEDFDFMAVLPPKVETELGRRKSKRIPSVGETRRRNRCLSCGQLGHNKSSCPFIASSLDVNTQGMGKTQPKKAKKG